MVVAAEDIAAGGAVGGGEAAEAAGASTEENAAKGAGSKRAQNRRDKRRSSSGYSRARSFNPVKHPVRTAQTINRIELAPATGTVQLISKHSHEGILFWSFALLALATWSGFWAPTINTIWKGDPWQTKIDGKLILGGILFAIVLAMLADSSDDAASLITWMLVAMWLLFLMFNGGDTIKNFFGWFQSGLGSITGGGAGNLAQQQAATTALIPVVNTLQQGGKQKP